MFKIELLDKLTHKEILLLYAHTTDTHGFSEVVFAVMELAYRPANL